MVNIPPFLLSTQGIIITSILGVLLFLAFRKSQESA